MKPSYDVEIGKVTYNGTEIPLKSGGGSTNKFTQLVDRSITEVTADDLAGVTSIGSSAFSGCSSLTTITIPVSVTSIGYSAFRECSSLKTITIPDSVTSIGWYAFRECSSLKTITIPDSVKSIGANAFYDCSNLTTITIPVSVTSIGANAFYDCSNLTSVTYDGQAPNISSGTFYSCSKIQLYDFRNCTTVPSLSSTSAIGHASGCQIVIPDALYEQWQQATNWSSLTDVVWVKASEYVEG